MWQAQVFTLYPEVFPGPLSKGLYGKALSKKLWSLNIVNIRDAAGDKHKTVDDTPYGGGSGMLLKADVLAKSLDENKIENERILYLSPKGKKFDQNDDCRNTCGNRKNNGVVFFKWRAADQGGFVAAAKSP